MSIGELARKYKIARSSMGEFIRRVKIQWQRELTADPYEILAEIRQLKYVAWQCHLKGQEVPETTESVIERLTKEGAPSGVAKKILRRTRRVDVAVWLRIVAWCIEQEARITGAYAQPPGMNVLEIRAAGNTAEELDRQLENRLRDVLEVEYEQAEQTPSEVAQDSGR